MTALMVSAPFSIMRMVKERSPVGMERMVTRRMAVPFTAFFMYFLMGLVISIPCLHICDNPVICTGSQFVDNDIEQGKDKVGNTSDHD